MPKPIESASGSGLHIAQVLADTRGDNAFFDAGQRYALSPLACQFIAGQLAMSLSITVQWNTSA